LKSMVTGHDVHGILVEAERAEDWSLKCASSEGWHEQWVKVPPG